MTFRTVPLEHTDSSLLHEVLSQEDLSPIPNAARDPLKRENPLNGFESDASPFFRVLSQINSLDTQFSQTSYKMEKKMTNNFFKRTAYTQTHNSLIRQNSGSQYL